MESLTRLVSESLIRHGFDRPLDYRRLRWSRWFRCESHHSLLVVPSKPGVFALAEEIIGVGTDAHGREPEAESVWDRSAACPERSGLNPVRPNEARLGAAAATVAPGTRRMLAVTQFLEDDDMAYALDRMLSRQNPMCARLISGRYFVRFVVIEDKAQRRSICDALNQWVTSSSEKVSGIGAHFAASLDARVGRAPLHASVGSTDADVARTLLSATASAGTRQDKQVDPSRGSAVPPAAAPQLDSGAASNMLCPCPFPSGF